MSPRSGLFRGSAPMVRIDQIPELVRDLIRGLDTLPSYVEDRVYKEQDYPLEPGKSTPPWARISVWLRRENVQPKENPTGQIVVCFAVKVETTEQPPQAGIQDHSWDYLRVIADLHDRVFGAVNGVRLGEMMRMETIGDSETETVTKVPVRCVGMITEAPLRDDKNNTWEQMCEYNTVLVRRVPPPEEE